VTLTPEEPVDWTPRTEPLGSPAAPVPGTPVPYQYPSPQQPRYIPPQPGGYLPPPQRITYVQPVARRGLTGPHAAVYITLLVLGVLVVLPVLCCLGLAVMGSAGSHPYVTSTP
jgi:hypothetical protein